MKCIILLAVVLVLVSSSITKEDDFLEKLNKLRKLKDLDIISENEYSTRKNDLIDLYLGGAPVKRTPDYKIVIDHNKGKNNTTWRMPIVWTKKVKWLMELLENGMPRSYNDVLPATGKLFWYSQLYLTEGPQNPNMNNTIVPYDDEVAIQERALTHIGLNLYDGGVWSVALALSGLGEIVNLYYRNVLYVSSTGSNPIADGLQNIRASSETSVRDYYYGPKQISDKSLDKVKLPNNSTYVHLKVPTCCGSCCATTATHEIPGGYFYRMIGPSYRMWDPLQGYYGWKWRAKPAGPNNDTAQLWNLAGMIHWNDWKPITGENVWAVLLAPTQTMFISNCSHIRKFSKFEDAPEQIQFAISILPACMALMSPLGSMYHCPKGTQMFPADPDEKTNVSNENNFSAYAAFRATKFILDNFYTKGDTDLDKASKNLDDLIKGLEKWFKTQLMPHVIDGHNVVSQGGHVSFSGEYKYQKGWQAFAVDCQTWGLLNIGQKNFDANYKHGMAYQVWKSTKKLSGYYINGKLAGVGYTVQPNDTSKTIWSGEWTWGAVFMCKRIGHEYIKIGESAWGNELLDDAKSMVEMMSMDAKTDYDGVWSGGGLVQVDGSYLYANNRFFIPWGWYANPIGATSSTGWAVFNDFDYNPFQLGGGFNASGFWKNQCKDWKPEKEIMQKLAKYYDYEYKDSLYY